MLGDWASFVYTMVLLEKPYVVFYDFVTYIVVVLKKSLKLLLVLHYVIIGRKKKKKKRRREKNAGVA